MRLLTLGLGDLRLAMRDPGAIFWIFVAPFLWVFFFGFLNRPSDPAHARIDLTVVNHDTSPASARLIEAIRAESFELTLISDEAALPQGDDAPLRTLTIPATFGDAITRRQKIGIDLDESENANREGTFAVQLALHRAVIRLLADESFGPQEVSADQVKVHASYAGRRVTPSGYAQTVPGNLVMFVLMVSMSYGAGLLAHEKKTRTLARLATSPLTRRELILGKLAGRMLMATVQVTLFVLLGLTFYKMDWGSSPLGLVLVLLSLIACAAALGLMGGALVSSGDAAAGLGVSLVLVMSALGGCWWPAEIMPKWLQRVGLIFPTAWAMDGLHQLASWGGGVREILLPTAVLTLFALGAGAVAVRRLRFD